jgi:hypothetical protein
MCALVIGGQQRELSAKVTGTQAQIPSNPYIKLAYYLSCVHGTSSPESIPNRLSSWESMNGSAHRSTDELREMLSWSERYSPVTLKTAGYFIMVPPDSLPSANKFVTITAQTKRVGILATNQATLAMLQQSSQSVEIMVYEECWEDNNYYNPRRDILGIIKDRESHCNVF